MSTPEYTNKRDAAIAALKDLTTYLEDNKMLLCPPASNEPLKRYVITSHNEGDTLANGDIITWVDNGTLTNPNDRVNVDVNGVDQGVSTQAGNWTLQNLPAGPIEICLQEMIFDGAGNFVGTGPNRCCYDYVVDQPITGNLEKAYDLDAIPLGTISAADWETMTGGAWNFTGTDGLVNAVDAGGDRWIQVDHLAGVLNVQNGTCFIDRKEGNDSYTVSQCIEFAPDFDHGGTDTSANSGKLGFGLAGGRDANGGLIDGGDSDTTGYSFRPGFDVYNGSLNLMGYSYYANRPGMPSTGQVFGHAIDTGVQIIPGNKYIVLMTVNHNTPGVADGSLVMEVQDANGVTLGGFTQNNVLLMDGTPYTDINTFGSWHGGSAAFAPPVDTHVRYKDIQIFCN